MNRYTCVIRNVAGIDQYIPIADAFHIQPGERSYTGTFRTEPDNRASSNRHVTRPRTKALIDGTWS